MHTVVRSYSGKGAAEQDLDHVRVEIALVLAVEQKLDDLAGGIIDGFPGLGQKGPEAAFGGGSGRGRGGFRFPGLRSGFSGIKGA